MFYLVVLFFLCIKLVGNAACNGVWTGASGIDNNWGTPTNWSSCIPQVQDDSALFSIPTSQTTVNVNIAPSISFLTFNSNSSYFLSGVGPLTFLNTTAGTSAILRDSLGQHFFNVPIQLNNTSWDVFIDDPSGRVTIQNTVTDLSISSLQLFGSGALTNLDNTTFTLNGDLTVNSGTLNNVNTTVAMSMQTQNLLLPGGTMNNTNNRVPIGSSEIGIQILETEEIIVSGGILENVNNAAIGGMLNHGIFMEAQGEFSLLGGNVLNANHGNVTGIANRGSTISSASATIFGGSFTLLNTGRIAGANSIGSEFRIAGNFLMTSGSLTLDNQGEVLETTGARVSSNQFQLDGGTVLLTNSGNVHGPFAEGSTIEVTNTLTINDGLLINGTSSPSSVGVTSLVLANDIIVNGGVFINRSVVRTANLIINQNGILAGNGDFASLTFSPAGLQVINNGTVIPGDPFLGGNPGRLAFLGSYTQSPTGTLGINILNTGNFSQLFVDQTAQLAGNLAIGFTPGFQVIPGDAFRILEALGGVTGTFNDPAPTCFLIPHLQYFPDFVLLSFTPTMCTYIAEFVETIFSSVNQDNLFLTSEMEKLRRRSQCLESCYGLPGNFYIGPTGGVGNVKTRDQQIGFDYWSAGVRTGIDYAFLHSGIGLLAEYERIEGKGDQDWGTFDIDQLHASFYGTFYPGMCRSLTFNTIIGGSYEWYSFERNLFPFFSQKAKAHPHGWEFDAFIGSEYAFQSHCFSWIPLISLQYIQIDVHKYKEDGAELFDLEIQEQKAKSLRSTLGMRSNYTWLFGSTTVFLEGTIGWQREYLDKSRSIQFQPIHFSEPILSIPVVESDRNLLIGSFDFLVTWSSRYGLEVYYGFDWNRNFQNNSFYLGWDFNF